MAEDRKLIDCDNCHHNDSWHTGNKTECSVNKCKCKKFVYDSIGGAAQKAAEYLYQIKGNVDPEIARRIGTLRQLINEEFVAKKRQISSQLIYDILRPVIANKGSR